MITSLVMNEPLKTKPQSSLQMPGMKKKVENRVDHSRHCKVSKTLKEKEIPLPQQEKVAKKEPWKQPVIKVPIKRKG